MKQQPIVIDIPNASDEELRAAQQIKKLPDGQYWKIDKELHRRSDERLKVELVEREQNRRANTRAELADNPFDPRNEVSATRSTSLDRS